MEKIAIRKDELEKIRVYHPEFRKSILAEVKSLKNLVKSFDSENYNEAKNFIEERKCFLFNEL